MKYTKFLCDRCGKRLGEEGAALEKTRFCTQKLIFHRLKFFKDWKKDVREPVVYELCESCRESLDKWLMRRPYL